MKRQRWAWLAAAAVLVAGAAFLMSRADAPKPESAAARVEFPRRLRAEERQRMVRRRTLPVRPPPPEDAPEAPVAAGPPPHKDPLLAALPSRPKRGLVVVEANALRHSPVGELLIHCWMQRGGERRLQRMREMGLDPLQDVDRVAVADEVLVVSGHFQKALGGSALAELTREPYGEQAALYRDPKEDASEPVVGVWGDSMVLVGREEQVRSTLDRMARGGDDEPSTLDENMTYGDIYGVLAPDRLEALFPEAQKELAGKLREVVQQVELHVDATRDVGIVVKAKGNGRDNTDLGKSLGSALALARLQAQAEGREQLVEYLDLARVRPDSSGFQVELGLPLEMLEKHLARVCPGGAGAADAAQPAP